jgi:hypothetical protein
MFVDEDRGTGGWQVGGRAQMGQLAARARQPGRLKRDPFLATKGKHAS